MSRFWCFLLLWANSILMFSQNSLKKPKGKAIKILYKIKINKPANTNKNAYPHEKSILYKLPSTMDANLATEDLYNEIIDILITMGLPIDQVNITFQQDKSSFHVSMAINMNPQKIKPTEPIIEGWFVKDFKINPSLMEMIKQTSSSHMFFSKNTFFNRATIKSIMLLFFTFMQQNGDILGKPKFKYKNNIINITDKNQELPPITIGEIDFIFCFYNKNKQLKYTHKIPQKISTNKMKEALMINEENPILTILSLVSQGVNFHKIFPRDPQMLKAYLYQMGYLKAELLDIKYIVSQCHKANALVYIYTGPMYKVKDVILQNNIGHNKKLLRDFHKIKKDLKNNKDILVPNVVPTEVLRVCEENMRVNYQIRKIIRFLASENKCIVYFYVEADYNVKFIADIHFSGNKTLVNPYGRILSKTGDVLSMAKIHDDVDTLRSLLHKDIQIKIHSTNSINGYIVDFQIPEEPKEDFLSSIMPKISVDLSGLKIEKEINTMINVKDMLIGINTGVHMETKALFLQESVRMVILSLNVDITDILNFLIIHRISKDLKVTIQTSMSLLPSLIWRNTPHNILDNFQGILSMNYEIYGMHNNCNLTFNSSSKANNIQKIESNPLIKITKNEFINTLYCNFQISKMYSSIFLLMDYFNLNLGFYFFLMPYVPQPSMSLQVDYLGKLFKKIIINNITQCKIHPSITNFFTSKKKSMHTKQYNNLFDTNQVKILGFQIFNGIMDDGLSLSNFATSQIKKEKLRIPCFLKNSFFLKRKIHKINLFAGYVGKLSIGIFNSLVIFQNLDMIHQKNNIFWKSSCGLLSEFNINKGFVILQLFLCAPLKSDHNDLTNTIDFNVSFNNQNKQGVLNQNNMSKQNELNIF